MPTAEITVMLVDDHHLVRLGFRRMLEDEAGLRVVGEARDGHESVELAAKLKPAVIVMDFALPSMNGAVATRMILKDAPGVAVLMLSMHSDLNYVRACLDAGARGYLLKNAMDLELVDAIQKVAAGAQVLDRPLGVIPGTAASESATWTTRDLDGEQIVCTGNSNP